MVNHILFQMPSQVKPRVAFGDICIRICPHVLRRAIAGRLEVAGDARDGDVSGGPGRLVGNRVMFGTIEGEPGRVGSCLTARGGRCMIQAIGRPESVG